MKSILLFLTLLLAAPSFAQDYQYFEVNDLETMVFLRLKASYSPAPRKRNPDIRVRDFRTVNNVACCMQKIATIFQKHFAGLTDDELAALKPVKYILLFDKDFMVWNFAINFPKQSSPVILKYEANCYHFGKELIGFDLSPYVIPANPKIFAGSDFHFQLFMPMRYF